MTECVLEFREVFNSYLDNARKDILEIEMIDRLISSLNEIDKA